MEETITLTNSSSNRTQQGSDSVDDEYSTDSGCSSGSSSGSSSGGSSSSAEHLPRCRKGDHESSSSHRRNSCHLHHVDCHHHNEAATTRSQERLSRSKHSCQRGRANTSRSFSLSEPECNDKMSPSHSSSPSDANSTDSELSKKSSKPEMLRRALHCLKIGKTDDNGCKEKKLTKRSPRRILREPVLYTYVRGLSGLPTQRVPRNNVRAFGVPCSCQDNISLYWNNPDRR